MSENWNNQEVKKGTIKKLYGKLGCFISCYMLIAFVLAIAIIPKFIEQNTMTSFTTKEWIQLYAMIAVVGFMGIAMAIDVAMHSEKELRLINVFKAYFAGFRIILGISLLVFFPFGTWISIKVIFKNFTINQYYTKTDNGFVTLTKVTNELYVDCNGNYYSK